MNIFGELWLDNLYVRLTVPVHDSFDELIAGGSSSNMWMTNVTLQGNGEGNFDCYSCGLSTSGSLYAYGSAASSLCAACAHQVSK